MAGRSHRLPPPMTFSDWLVGDNSGYIYATGPFPEGLQPMTAEDLGKPIVVAAQCDSRRIPLPAPVPTSRELRAASVPRRRRFGELLCSHRDFQARALKVVPHGLDPTPQEPAQKRLGNSGEGKPVLLLRNPWPSSG